MNDHSEKECTEIHTNFDFHVTVLAANEGSKHLVKWYERVFKAQHPDNYGDFKLEFTPDYDEYEVLEITALNPMFNTDALLSLYFSFKQSNNTIVNDTEKVTMVS